MKLLGTLNLTSGSTDSMVIGINTTPEHKTNYKFFSQCLVIFFKKPLYAGIKYYNKIPEDNN